jgi:DNA-binding MarR family transcriptional regulator
MAAESRDLRRDLEVLTAIEEGGSLTQRALAERLGIALGLTNLYIRRLATKGFIKVTEFPTKPAARKRLRYLLTAKGISEKTRLTYEYMERSLVLYRRARHTLRQTLAELPEPARARIALYGVGEAAELAYLTLKEFRLDPVGVFAREPRGTFLGMPVRDVRELAALDCTCVIVATFDRPKRHVPLLLEVGLPAEKLLTLQPMRRNGHP